MTRASAADGGVRRRHESLPVTSDAPGEWLVLRRGSGETGGVAGGGDLGVLAGFGNIEANLQREGKRASGSVGQL